MEATKMMQNPRIINSGKCVMTAPLVPFILHFESDRRARSVPRGFGQTSYHTPEFLKTYGAPAESFL
jgi:hypothetical protein